MKLGIGPRSLTREVARLTPRPAAPSRALLMQGVSGSRKRGEGSSFRRRLLSESRGPPWLGAAHTSVGVPRPRLAPKPGSPNRALVLLRSASFIPDACPGSVSGVATWLTCGAATDKPRRCCTRMSRPTGSRSSEGRRTSSAAASGMTSTPLRSWCPPRSSLRRSCPRSLSPRCRTCRRRTSCRRSCSPRKRVRAHRTRRRAFRSGRRRSCRSSPCTCRPPRTSRSPRRRRRRENRRRPCSSSPHTRQRR